MQSFPQEGLRAFSTAQEQPRLRQISSARSAPRRKASVTSAPCALRTRPSGCRSLGLLGVGSPPRTSGHTKIASPRRASAVWQRAENSVSAQK